MPISIPTTRLTGLLVSLFLTTAAPMAMAGHEGESRHVAKYSNMVVDDRYLYPGGEVVLAVDRLSLPEERIMTLTFDDGPDERDLEIAALLKKHHITAAFFYVGNKVEALSGVVKEIIAAKHEIAYHSYRHQMMGWFGPDRLAEDFRRGKATMTNLGVSLTWFRPPYGDFNSKVVQAAKDQGMETILWTIDSRDWTGISAQTMAQRVIRQFHPGAVLLFHSIHGVTLKALPEVLAAAEKENYRFVGLGEWRQTILTANCRAEGRSCPAAPATVVAAPVVPAGGEVVAAVAPIVAILGNPPPKPASPAASEVIPPSEIITLVPPPAIADAVIPVTIPPQTEMVVIAVHSSPSPSLSQPSEPSQQVLPPVTTAASGNSLPASHGDDSGRVDMEQID